MRLSIAFCLCLYAKLLFGQDCDCLSQLNYTIHYYEQNNPAFQKIKAHANSYKLYLNQVQAIKSEAQTQGDIDLCILYLDRYVGLLKDHHSEISFNLKRIDLSTPELIDDFKKSKNYLAFKKVAIDTAKIIPALHAKKISDIEGVYSNGTSIVFGIIKTAKKPNNYIGVVLKSNKLLDVGHVLIELTKVQANTYNVTYNIGLLGFNFQKMLKKLYIENGQILSLGFSKTNPVPNKKEYEFKSLNDSTNYLRLSSFDRNLTRELDSLYDVVDKEITSKPFLIIDIRSNGGGSENSYLNLLKYAYEKPFKIDPALVWVSPDNIKYYEETGAGNNKNLVERMKAAQPFTFIPQSEDLRNTWALDEASVFPKKIALLFDRGTASSGEGMIYYFMQSTKVITIGENSGGYIGYGNVMTAPMPCDKFAIRSTTTMYLEKSKYEFIGIEPMYKAPKKQDWIMYANKLLTHP
jgi:hypothetical protein